MRDSKQLTFEITDLYPSSKYTQRTRERSNTFRYLYEYEKHNSTDNYGKIVDILN